MIKPKFITFTGFDDRTSIEDMEAVSERYPVEWGVLISPTNRDARFPSVQAIQELNGAEMHLSLHCCGGFSKAVQMGNPGKLPVLIDGDFKRVQLNGKILMMQDKLVPVASALEVDVIIQNRKNCFHGVPLENVVELFDTSGGKGILPDKFPKYPRYFCGYTGGLNPENVLEVIKRIDAPEGAEYYIDMETGVRTNGWFDLSKVAKVCRLVYGETG